jgi:hypothetical protein
MRIGFSLTEGSRIRWMGLTIMWVVSGGLRFPFGDYTLVTERGTGKQCPVSGRINEPPSSLNHANS